MSKTDPNDADRLLGRVLGPAEPEVSCEQCFDELDRYVELELAGADAESAISGMRAHFDGCSACAEDYRSLRALLLAERAEGSA
jgi:hypothetical protein